MIERIQRKFSRFVRLDNSVEIQNQATLEALDGIKFLTATRGAEWVRSRSFYPGGWAADYKLLTTIYRLLNDFRPKAVLEFGMGETTKMLSAYASELEPGAVVYTVEHNPEWQAFFSNDESNLRAINVVNVEMEQKAIKGELANYYVDLLAKLPKNTRFELFIVDGPNGSPKYSRFNLCEVIQAGLLADEFVLLLDDAHRPGERDTIAQAEQIMSERAIEFKSAFIQGAQKQTYAAFTRRFGFLDSV